LLFVLAMAVLTIHTVNAMRPLRVLFGASDYVRSPFSTDKKSVSEIKPESEAAGMKIGDSLVAINGRQITNNQVFYEELNKASVGEKLTITVERKDAKGGVERKDLTITAAAVERNAAFYGGLIVGLIFQHLLPVFCFLLGFWVALVRPRDFLAWLLLFLLLGMGSIGLESSLRNPLVKFFFLVFINVWAISMLLFGIYFPERWSLDKKLPWAKWLFIVPIGANWLINFFQATSELFGFGYEKQIGAFFRPLYNVSALLTFIAIGLFFAAIGHKSGTLKHPDARRRLRLMTIGTMVAMGPSFLVLIWGMVRGIRGSFFDRVPFWLAIIALLMMVLFPLTMAYVIVVQRAMDVSVVIRQGLQYALAKNSILVLQIMLCCGILFSAVWVVQNTKETNWGILLFFVVGVGAFFLIGKLADRLKTWIDKKFFREAYNAEHILSDLSENVRTIIETEPLLETVARRVSESLHVSKIALLLKNDNAYKPAYALGYESSPSVSFGEKTETVERLKQNEPLIIYSDDPESWVNKGANGEHELLDQLDTQLLLPMGVKEKLTGFISLGPKLSEEPYSPTDLRLLKSVAAQTGLALENSQLTEAIAHELAQREKLNREIEIAREVQERLFPQCFPEINGLDFCGACRPALGVGGDYYDFLMLPSKHLGIAIGDVSGKGISAALLMASLQASLRGQAIQGTNDLASLIGNVNKLVHEASAENRYATFFYAQYEPETRSLTYVNAGHNPPMIFRRKNGDEIEIIRLETGGPVVGLLPMFPYSQETVTLQSGDLFVGFTDGISEAMNNEEEEWGEERMIEAIKARYETCCSSELLSYLIERADEFAAGAKQHDDMTLIVVRVI
jgi:sigma-B regulation protein RsbU (phosphoserine phosphatase)